MQLYKQLRKWSDLFPEKIAFSCGNEQLTYRQLHEMSESLAYYLNEFLPNDSTPIVVYGHMEPLMLVCFLASVKSGHPYIPVDTSIPEERIFKIIQDSGAKMLISPVDIPLLETQDISHFINGSRLREILTTN